MTLERPPHSYGVTISLRMTKDTRGTIWLAHVPHLLQNNSRSAVLRTSTFGRPFFANSNSNPLMLAESFNFTSIAVRKTVNNSIVGLFLTTSLHHNIIAARFYDFWASRWFILLVQNTRRAQTARGRIQRGCCTPRYEPVFEDPSTRRQPRTLPLQEHAYREPESQIS